MTTTAFPSSAVSGQNPALLAIPPPEPDPPTPPAPDDPGQALPPSGCPIEDSEVDRQVEAFPLVVRAHGEGGVEGFLFGSLERVGGTPCVLWGLGAAVANRQARKTLAALADELFRRAAITFPDEDVLVGGRFSQPAGYALLDGLADRVPRADHKSTGEERAWGRRLAKRFGCDGGYDDRSFLVPGPGGAAPVADAVSVNGSGPKRALELFEGLDGGRGDSIIAFGWAMAESLANRLSV